MTKLFISKLIHISAGETISLAQLVSRGETKKMPKNNFLEHVKFRGPTQTSNTFGT